MNSKDPLAILSEHQKCVLKEFRETVQDILQPQHDDYYLLRWLRARDFDLRKSEKMIRESFKFRKKLNIDDILSGKYVEPEVFRQFKTTTKLGFDKDGCIVRMLLFGICDFKGFMYSLHTPDLLKLIMFILESDAKEIQERNAKTGSHEARSVYLCDFSDFNLRQFYDKHVIHMGIQVLSMYQDNYPETLKVAYFVNVIHMVIQVLGMYQDNYPETLKVAYLVNVPTYFNWIWNIFKPFLDAVTLSKIKIHTADSTSWKAELFDIVDPKIIPAYLGGVRCDPDGNPTCQTVLRWPKKIPTSFYLKDKSVLRPSDPDVKSIAVRERSHFEHRIAVDKPGSTIRWEFQTKDYNIRFGILFEKVKSAKIPNAPADELIAVENVECHVLPESGELICEKAGQYILHFDNSYSWFTSKHLMYKVTVEEPEKKNTDDN